MEKRLKTTHRVWIALLMTWVVGGCVTYPTGSPSHETTPPQVHVPAVIGMEQGKAIENLIQSGLDFSLNYTLRYTGQTKPAIVIDQQPRAGDSVPPATAVELLIASSQSMPRVGKVRSLPPLKIPRISGRSFLVQNQVEAKGYGLYSYLLFRAPPSKATADRYLEAIRAYLELLPAITVLEEDYDIPRHELNITYLPLDTSPPPHIQPEWILEHYNYVHAQVLLRNIRGVHREGPYLISSLKPLREIETLSEPYIYQDLSSVPPRLVRLWVHHFLIVAQHEPSWVRETLEQLVLKLRQGIAILAEGLPHVEEAVAKAVSGIDLEEPLTR